MLKPERGAICRPGADAGAVRCATIQNIAEILYDLLMEFIRVSGYTILCKSNRGIHTRTCFYI